MLFGQEVTAQSKGIKVYISDYVTAQSKGIKVYISDYVTAQSKGIKVYISDYVTAQSKGIKVNIGASVPIIQVQNPISLSSLSSVTLDFSVTSSELPVVTLSQDSRGFIPVLEAVRVSGNTYFYKPEVKLSVGQNRFSITAKNNGGASKYLYSVEYEEVIKEKRLALVIGNASYVSCPLKNPVNDADDIAKVLRDLGFEVLIYKNVSKRDLVDAMDLFYDKLANFQISLLFYAGHGVQVKGENYLIPIDATLKAESDVSYECYPLSKILSRMGSRTPTNIVLLDACRNNPFERSWGVIRDVDGNGNGLTEMKNYPEGTFIGFATSPGSTAADGNGRNGVYTESILKNITKSGLTIDQIFNLVSGNVSKSTNKKQCPWKSSSMTGDFYFKK